MLHRQEAFVTVLTTTTYVCCVTYAVIHSQATDFVIAIDMMQNYYTITT